MPDTKSPRKGSMQFWPRVRAKRIYARIRSFVRGSEAKPMGFAGYKVGMTHVIYEDNTPNSMTKGMEIAAPATVIECPPLIAYGVRFLKRDEYADLKVIGDVSIKSSDKHLKRRLTVPKNIKKKIEDFTDFDEIRLLTYTQPSMAGFGKKKPDVFEMVVGGSKEDQLTFIKDNLGKEIKVQDTIAGGDVVDVHAVTTGKGFQGPVKRFGVNIRSHKSEKTKRGPGSIAGGWKAQGHMMYRVPHAGQMGFHQRKEFNKWILKVSDNPKEVNPKGGFIRYGNVKNPFILIKGSVPGPSKRLIRFTPSVRPNKKISREEPNIKYISIESKQK